MSSKSFISFTANIKANNNLYLMPSDYKEGIKNNSNSLTMKEKCEINGKWFILGLNVGSVDQIKSILNTL